MRNELKRDNICVKTRNFSYWGGGGLCASPKLKCGSLKYRIDYASLSQFDYIKINKKG